MVNSHEIQYTYIAVYNRERERESSFKFSFYTGTAPAARRPPGHSRRVTTTTTARPSYSSYQPSIYNSGGGGGTGGTSGRSGTRNTIGGNSLWTRLFGDSRGGTSTNSRDQRPSSPSVSTRHSSNNNREDNYKTHTSVDKNGNRVWTFSG